MSMITPMRFSADDGSQPFHSSVYAQAAHGQRIGSTSAQPYSQRRQLERQRQHVHHYGRSQLGQPVGEVRPLTVQARPETRRVQRIERAQPSGQHTFREPSVRYNPYQ